MDVDVLVYNIPEGYKIDLKQKDVDLHTPFGSYTLKSTLEGRKLTYIRMLALNNGLFPAEDYVKFADFLNTVSSNDQNKIVFSVN